MAQRTLGIILIATVMRVLEDVGYRGAHESRIAYVCGRYKQGTGNRDIKEREQKLCAKNGDSNDVCSV